VKAIERVQKKAAFIGTASIVLLQHNFFTVVPAALYDALVRLVWRSRSALVYELDEQGHHGFCVDLHYLEETGR
jgi:hypothetical protein